MSGAEGDIRETAARHMVSRVATGRDGETIASVLERLPGSDLDDTEAIYVVDEGGKLLGLIGLRELLARPGDEPLARVMRSDPPTVRPETDQESVASLAIEENLASVPVVDTEGVLLGVVPAQALLRILRREHVEDLQRFTGILNGNHAARDALEAPPARRARHRLPWLLVGLAGSFVATYVVAVFEQALQERIAIAFFVPGIVYLADAIGTQTEAIAVRGLSFSNHSLRKLLTGELMTGGIIGTFLCLLTFPLVLLAFGDVPLALAVSVSLVAAGCSATTVGLLFPWLLSRLGKDPAYGSGPLATIFQDVFSLLVYFGTVTLFLF